MEVQITTNATASLLQIFIALFLRGIFVKVKEYTRAVNKFIVSYRS